MTFPQDRQSLDEDEEDELWKFVYDRKIAGKTSETLHQVLKEFKSTRMARQRTLTDVEFHFHKEMVPNLYKTRYLTPLQILETYRHFEIPLTRRARQVLQVLTGGNILRCTSQGLLISWNSRNEVDVPPRIREQPVRITVPGHVEVLMWKHIRKHAERLEAQTLHTEYFWESMEMEEEDRERVTPEMMVDYFREAIMPRFFALKIDPESKADLMRCLRLKPTIAQKLWLIHHDSLLLTTDKTSGNIVDWLFWRRDRDPEDVKMNPLEGYRTPKMYEPSPEKKRTPVSDEEIADEESTMIAEYLRWLKEDAEKKDQAAHKATLRNGRRETIAEYDQEPHKRARRRPSPEEIDRDARALMDGIFAELEDLEACEVILKDCQTDQKVEEEIQEDQEVQAVEKEAQEVLEIQEKQEDSELPDVPNDDVAMKEIVYYDAVDEQYYQFIGDEMEPEFPVESREVVMEKEVIEQDMEWVAADERREFEFKPANSLIASIDDDDDDEIIDVVNFSPDEDWQEQLLKRDRVSYQYPVYLNGRNSYEQHLFMGMEQQEFSSVEYDFEQPDVRNLPSTSAPKRTVRAPKMYSPEAAPKPTPAPSYPKNTAALRDPARSHPKLYTANPRIPTVARFKSSKIQNVAAPPSPPKRQKRAAAKSPKIAKTPVKRARKEPTQRRSTRLEPVASESGQEKVAKPDASESTPSDPSPKEDVETWQEKLARVCPVFYIQTTPGIIKIGDTGIFMDKHNVIRRVPPPEPPYQTFSKIISNDKDIIKYYNAMELKPFSFEWDDGISFVKDGAKFEMILRNKSKETIQKEREGNERSTTTRRSFRMLQKRRAMSPVFSTQSSIQSSRRTSSTRQYSPSHRSSSEFSSSSSTTNYKSLLFSKHRGIFPVNRDSNIPDFQQ
ncbi:Protein CBG11107 [Caenorhabditis briggsae]|uniref:Protein CBG11107 n=3 Tax=Caenorhabditis briggsae TaxID=6238 RepID=A8XCF3_CAEBR|nr:Protein CBG11107 [Caenorhabditis briggsae]ULU04670.1 hypothetical protein L3Y34_017440 [Caenorhabditis briggsae]CAP30320.2 Protein CBG11107 [Caenorhabditis briggsae]